MAIASHRRYVRTLDVGTVLEGAHEMGDTGGQAPGLRWSWQADKWRWLPKTVWTPTIGEPNGTLQLEATTTEIPLGERFDFWREVALYDFAPDLPEQDRRQTFDAEGKAIFSERGTIEIFRANAMSGRAAAARSRRRDPRLYIGLMIEGERRHVSADGSSALLQPGDFFVLDTTRSTRVDWTDRRCVQLSLPLDLLAAEVGTRDLPSADRIAHTLAHSRLSGILRAQFKLLAKYSSELSEVELAAMNDIAYDVVASIVRASGDGAQAGREPLRGRALAMAARQYIQRNFAAVNLDADRIARAVGCSRATLYRAFAEQGTTVADALRQARLDQARRMLAAMPQVAISDIALRCGLPEARTFNRLFKQSYGMTPSELRRTGEAGGPSDPR
jgi:AraC-like DNA-binding protein